MRVRKFIKRGVWLLLGCISLLLIKTVWDFTPPDLAQVTQGNERVQVLDRNGTPLGISYQNRFNTLAVIPLHHIPIVLREAFIASEDKRFFTHHGVDWQARSSALWQNIRARKSVRGASTITEQVVRILNPRPRTLWSRWLEGWESLWLEHNASKGQILEFYMNQVPYAANRRGVAQAARYYFNRDLETLTPKEMLALAVLPRAPSALDLYRNPGSIEPRILRLADTLKAASHISDETAASIAAQPLTPTLPEPLTGAAHFIQYIRETIPYQLSRDGTLKTTLDAPLQQQVQTLLDERVASLKRRHVKNGAAVVVDHTTGEILAWAVAGSEGKNSGSAIDAVRTPRQPGSALKPFLYGLALDSGWSPATILNDAPLTEAVGTGLHDFRNYSRSFYGPVTLREALGNSLNIPAVLTIAFVTPQRYLKTLHALGFTSLDKPAEFYNDGLALGNGEVTLLEMATAYSTLARRGVYQPLTPIPAPQHTKAKTRIYSPEAASLIGNILSDSNARRKEFGAGSVLNLPVQTAVKTGTSTDYRDAWVLGYNARYSVGVWLGNLDRTSMDNVTGSTGPALVLRSIFAALRERDSRTAPLYLSPKLERRDICTNPQLALGAAGCFPRTEYFMPGSSTETTFTEAAEKKLRIVRPTQNLQIAYDPRLPAYAQAFEYVAEGVPHGAELHWILNGTTIATTNTPNYVWPVQRGKWALQIKAVDAAGSNMQSDSIDFNVK